MHVALLWVIPSVVFNALSFAIVRTYTIPSISRILCGTKGLQSDTVSKRCIDVRGSYASSSSSMWREISRHGRRRGPRSPDRLYTPLGPHTAILVATYSTCPCSTREAPSDFYAAFSGVEAVGADPRAYVAIARMNWLHEHYTIKNDDYLITLAYLVFLPIRWAERFGWRKLSPLEIHARYIFWRHIGELMHIRDIPGSAAEFEAWAEDYEAHYMLPADTHLALAEGMLNELASSVPSFARGLFKRLTICTMDERMRIAMKLPAQPRVLHAFLDASAAVVRFVGCHLLPPRTYTYCVVPVKSSQGPKDGSKLAHMHPLMKVTKPWYLRRPTGMWHIIENIALALRLRGPDDIPGTKYDEEGYRLEELGPARWKHAGHSDVMQKASVMTGCPPQGVWARGDTNFKAT